MNEEHIQEFKNWWLSRRSTKQRVKGLSLSDVTLHHYVLMLEKIPDIVITRDTDIDEMIIFIRTWLNKNTGEDKLFRTAYPQLISTIRTYIRMHEAYPDPKINRIARAIRTEIKIPVYKDVSGTDIVFSEKFLTKEQIRRIISTLFVIRPPHKIGNDKARLFFNLLYDTGCRINELCSITYKDIDFDSKSIIITGKGKYRRVVKLDIATDELLNEYISERSVVENETLFCWKTETAKIYFKEMVRLVSKKEFDKVSPHWFRHSRATHLAIVWKDIVKLKDYMGWSDIKMAETYVRNITLLPQKVQDYKSESLWLD